MMSAAVGDVQLLALEVCPLAPPSLSLLPEPRQTGENLALVLERIAARLGPERVLRPLLCEDHRAEWMTHWGLVCTCTPVPRVEREAHRRRWRHYALVTQAALPAAAAHTLAAASAPSSQSLTAASMSA